MSEKEIEKEARYIVGMVEARADTERAVQRIIRYLKTKMIKDADTNIR